MEIFQHYYDLVIGGYSTRAANYYVKHASTLGNYKLMKEYFDTYHAPKKLHYYMVTFNLKPACWHMGDEIDVYVRKQFTHRPALQIVEAAITRELTKRGVDHWHVQVTTEVPLCKDRFDYYIKRYGSVDISKSRSQNPQNTHVYQSKHTHIDHLTQEEDEPIDLTQGSSQNPQQGFTKSMFFDFE